jgi:hypothetical protein
MTRQVERTVHVWAIPRVITVDQKSETGGSPLVTIWVSGSRSKILQPTIGSTWLGLGAIDVPAVVGRNPSRLVVRRSPHKV